MNQTSIREAVGTVVAAKKVEGMLLRLAGELTPPERLAVTQELSKKSDQRLLDMWWCACDSAYEEADHAG